MRVSLMNRKILFASLFLLVFLTIPINQASATGVFPAVGQTFAYSITGSADWEAPLDVTIGFAATATLSVTAVGTTDFTLQQAVSGSVTWPTTTGTGEIALWTWTASDPDIAPSNTAFSFTTTGDVDLDNSVVSSPSGDEYVVAWLNWTSGSDEIFAWISYIAAGMIGSAALSLPLPPIFLTEGLPTFFYWNTSYSPWTGTPTTTDWNVESVATPLGVRNSYRNTTADSQSDSGNSASLTLDTWIDFETSILLKQTETVVIDNSGVMDYTMTLNIDLVSCSFFAAPIPIVLIIIAVIAIVIIIIVIFLLYWFVLRKRK